MSCKCARHPNGKMVQDKGCIVLAVFHMCPRCSLKSLGTEVVVVIVPLT